MHIHISQLVKKNLNTFLQYVQAVYLGLYTVLRHKLRYQEKYLYLNHVILNICDTEGACCKLAPILTETCKQ